MSQVTFGTILREARERKGYDLASAARRLRIRPDILRAIEEDDFSRMPPRGYARNMVNAYARLLGLNPTEITRMYLDEAYAYQVGRARTDVKASGFDMGGTSRTRRTRERGASPAESEENRAPRQNAFGRTLYDDRTSFSRSDYGHRGSEEGSGRGRLYSEGRTHTSRHTALPNTQYTNFYAGPKAPTTMQSKLPFIIAGGVVLVLLIIILVLIFGPKGNAEEDVSNMRIAGVTDTTEGQEGSAEQQEPQKPVEVAPTSAKVGYEVASGQEIYAVINNNGESAESMIAGPVKETVEVTGTWTFATWVTDAVTITVNGEAVAFDATDPSGMPMASVDFNAILEQWKIDHPSAANSAGTGANSANAGANAGDSAADEPAAQADTNTQS